MAVMSAMAVDLPSTSHCTTRQTHEALDSGGEAGFQLMSARFNTESVVLEHRLPKHFPRHVYLSFIYSIWTLLSECTSSFQLLSKHCHIQSQSSLQLCVGPFFVLFPQFNISQIPTESWVHINCFPIIDNYIIYFLL